MAAAASADNKNAAATVGRIVFALYVRADLRSGGEEDDVELYNARFNERPPFEILGLWHLLVQSVRSGEPVRTQTNYGTRLYFYGNVVKNGKPRARVTEPFRSDTLAAVRYGLRDERTRRNGPHGCTGSATPRVIYLPGRRPRDC